VADVFISYCRRDKDRVGLIRNGLESAAVSTWWDGDLPPSVEFSSDIDEQIAATKRVLVAWSTPASKSLYVKAEALRAMDHGKLVQVMLDKSPLPVPFNALNALDLRDWNGNFSDPKWDRVLEALKQGGPGVADDIDPRKVLASGVSGEQMIALWLAPALLVLPVVAGWLAVEKVISSDAFLWVAGGCIAALSLVLLSLVPTALQAFRGR
jgi:TIR domain